MCLIFGMEASLAPPFYRAPAACASVSRSGGATCDTLPPAGRSHAQSPRRTSTAEPTVTSRQVLAWLAGGAVVAIVWLAHPFATGLLLGALMGFTLQPAYERLARWSGRPLIASVCTVLAAGLAIVGSVVGFVSLFVTQAVALATAVREELKPGGAVSAWVNTVTGWLGRFGIS